MIRGGFLTAEERQDLTELARDGLAEHRLVRRANALVLLDRGMRSFVSSLHCWDGAPRARD
jgi:hypothetical protein